MRTALLVGGACAVACAAVLAFAASQGDDPAAPPGGKRAATPLRRPPPGPTPAQMVGQMIMSPMGPGTRPPARLLRRVARGQVGGVILMGVNVRSDGQVRAALRRLQEAARRGGHPPLLVATDQEGGVVKRFPAAPPTLAPADMGRAAVARAQGRATARRLAPLGVSVDLAPVVDVPAPAGSFLGSRAFGRGPRTVAGAACAFADGLHAGGMAATLKHFPGLGTARANTDFAPARIQTTAARLRAAYAPYRACLAREGPTLVMVANAAYPALDRSGLPAVIAPRLLRRELRERLGFDGVVITDALETPGIQRFADAPERAARAGVDVLLYAGTEAASAEAFRRLLAAVRTGRVPRATVAAAHRRIMALKTALHGR